MKLAREVRGRRGKKGGRAGLEEDAWKMDPWSIKTGVKGGFLRGTKYLGENHKEVHCFPAVIGLLSTDQIQALKVRASVQSSSHVALSSLSRTNTHAGLRKQVENAGSRGEMAVRAAE